MKLECERERATDGSIAYEMKISLYGYASTREKKIESIQLNS